MKLYRISMKLDKGQKGEYKPERLVSFTLKLRNNYVAGKLFYPGKAFDLAFEELFSDCPKLLAQFNNETILWEDAAGHVFAYERMCK